MLQSGSILLTLTRIAMTKLEYKSITTGAIKAVEGRTVMGYFAIFNNIDSDDDVILPGAFAKTIQENGKSGKNRIWMLKNHNSSLELTKPDVLIEDSVGLYFEGTFPETTLCNDTLAQYKTGNMTEHSIGYVVINSYTKTVDGREIRYITELKLYEGSCVLWAANELAQTVGVKSERIESLENEIKQIKALLTSKEPPQQTEQPEVKELTTEEVKQLFNLSLN